MSKAQKKYSVTVGIPAFNEARTISVLLADLQKQKSTRTVIEKVIVYSDGSTDETVTLVDKSTWKIVSVIDSKKRQGKAVGLNTIFKKANSDSVVILDADVRLFDSSFIEKLVAPLITDSTDLTSAKVLEITPKNLLQKVLATSMDLKRTIFATWNNGDNVYTCHGRSRAFSRKLYKQLSFPFSPSEDAFSYLQCQALGCTYAYVKNTAVYYSLPETLADHVTQSIRFFQHHASFEGYFSKEVLDAEYNLPLALKLKYVALFILKKPVDILLYVALVGFVKITLLTTPTVGNQWTISDTSKRF